MNFHGRARGQSGDNRATAGGEGSSFSDWEGRRRGSSVIYREDEKHTCETLGVVSSIIDYQTDRSNGKFLTQSRF